MFILLWSRWDAISFDESFVFLSGGFCVCSRVDLGEGLALICLIDRLGLDVELLHFLGSLDFQVELLGLIWREIGIGFLWVKVRTKC